MTLREKLHEIAAGTKDPSNFFAEIIDYTTPAEGGDYNRWLVAIGDFDDFIKANEDLCSRMVISARFDDVFMEWKICI